MKYGLAGKTALVTGGSRGIGKAVAVRLASEGAQVAICARGEEGLAAAKADIEHVSGAPVLAIQADCSDAASIRRLVSRVLSEFERLDVLINCVGRSIAGPFLELSDEDWFNAINLTLMAAVRVTREVLPHMMNARSGSIVNVGGVFELQPSPFSVPTCVVNAALFNFTKALAQDALNNNVRINAVAPGRVDTPLFQQLVTKHAKISNESRERVLEKILSEVPMGRAGSVTEIASSVVYLASDLASYVSGVVLTIDGGWT